VTQVVQFANQLNRVELCYHDKRNTLATAPHLGTSRLDAVLNLGVTLCEGAQANAGLAQELWDV